VVPPNTKALGPTHAKQGETALLVGSSEQQDETIELSCAGQVAKALSCYDSLQAAATFSEAAVGRSQA